MVGQVSAVNQNVVGTNFDPAADPNISALITAFVGFVKGDSPVEFLTALNTWLAQRGDGSVSYTPTDAGATTNPLPTTATTNPVGADAQASNLPPEAASLLAAAMRKHENDGVADGVMDGSEFTKFLGSTDFDDLPTDVKRKTQWVYDHAANNDFHKVDEWVAKIAKANPPANWQPQTV